jgi:hypothetical protein
MTGVTALLLYGGVWRKYEETNILAKTGVWRNGRKQIICSLWRRKIRNQHLSSAYRIRRQAWQNSISVAL